MKKIVKSAGLISLLGASFLFTGDNQVSANSASCATYGTLQPGVNPAFQHVNCLATKAALKYDIPPEVLKAVLTQETGDWKQFDASGQAVVSADGGIGLMQLTNRPQFEEEKLKTSVEYNLDAGAQILASMYDRMPKITNATRDTIENWYFPVMAYNGTKPVNSPLKKDTGEVNVHAYQEQVFAKIEASSLINDTILASIPFSPEDFQYDSASSANIVFNKFNYTVSEQMHETAYKLQKGSRVITNQNNVALRKTPGGTEAPRLNGGSVLTVTGSFQFTENKDSKNQFVWYPVKTADGKTGFVSSAYIEKTTLPLRSFPDLTGAKTEITTLVNAGIISGGEDGLFYPDRAITREEAAILMLRALNLPAGKSVTVAIQDHGIMKGYPDGTFGKTKPVSRGEMAIILANAFKLTAMAPVSFTDVSEGTKAYKPIKQLVAANITKGYENNTFQPDKQVSRSEFAVLLYRALYQ